MYKEDVKRQEKEAELADEKSENLNNLIVDDGASNSQQDDEIESMKSAGSKKAQSAKNLNKDLNSVNHMTPQKM